MKAKLKTVGPIKIKGNPQTRGTILQTLQKVFGTPINGFDHIQDRAVKVIFRPQQKAELMKFLDQFLGKIEKGTYFFDEIETSEQKLVLLLDIGGPIAIQGTQRGEYESSIYPNYESRVYVTAINKH